MVADESGRELERLANLGKDSGSVNARNPTFIL